MSKGTPIRPVRVSESLWSRALAAAHAGGFPLSEFIRWALTELADGRIKYPPPEE